MPSNYRRFVAPTLEKARQRMIETMGVNAYINRTETIVKRKWLGLKKETYYAIDAAVHTGADIAPLRREAPRRPPAVEAVETSRMPTGSAELLRLLGEKRRASTAAPLAERAPSPRVLPETHEAPAPRVAPPPVETRPPTAPDFANVARWLEEREFEPAFAREIALDAKVRAAASPADREKLADTIVSRIGFVEGTRIYDTTPNAVFFVGPTGAGKTTSLAKIAAHHLFRLKRRIVMGTFDIYRIMAPDQLRKFAEIFKVPFFVISEDSRELVAEIKRHLDAQILFIDTSGTTALEEERMKLLTELVSTVQIPKEVHLCLPSTFRFREMRRVLEAFRSTEYDRVILTKIDESSTLGPALSAVASLELPLSWITHGQDASGDLLKASRETVKTRLLAEWKAS